MPIKSCKYIFGAHSRQFRSGDSLIACHTYCDMGHPFTIRSSPRTRDIHACCQALAVELQLPLFTYCHDQCLNIRPSACDVNALTNCATAAAIKLHDYTGEISIYILNIYMFNMCAYFSYVSKRMAGSQYNYLLISTPDTRSMTSLFITSQTNMHVHVLCKRFNLTVSLCLSP